MDINWKIEKHSDSAASLVFDCTEKAEGAILFMADEHVDNLHCDRELLERHHIQARQEAAPIIKVGDVFDAMGGKWDPRSSQDALRPEHKVNNYLDVLVSTSIDFYKPFAENIAVISPGNHESSIFKRHQTNLTSRMCDGLKALGSPVVELTYVSFLSLCFRIPADRRSVARTVLLHHGFGGGGEVTRGLIDNNRMRGLYDADVYVAGHIHRKNVDHNHILELTPGNKVVEREQIFLRCSTYKDESQTMDGYHAEKGRAGRPKGGYWLHYSVSRISGKGIDVKLVPIPA